MKIGILTFHRAINYGAVLQCYALFQTLHMKGHEVEVIDYRPEYIEKYRTLFIFSKTQNPIVFCKNLLRSALLFNERKKAIRNFDDFISKIDTSPVVKNADDIAALKYDLIICGSDQIWNRRITNNKYDLFYWGQFEHPNTKIASYAASYGTVNSSSDVENMLKKMLNRIDAIGVREKDFANYLKILGLDAHVCVDPTILANQQIFYDLVEKPTDDNYILVYALKEREKVVLWAKKIQEKNGLKIVVLGGNVSIKTYYGINVKVIQGVSPKLYLGYFKKAKIVVNTSFHGTVFSTLFRKDFYSLDVDNSGRYKQYLDAVGLSDRFVKFDDTPSLRSIDYSEFEDRKMKLVKESELYINQLGI